MPASQESVSDNQPARRAGGILIVGVNWLGDSLMSMPAIQAYRRAYPQTRIVMLVKPAMRPLWLLHPAPDEVWICGHALAEIRRAAQATRAAGFATAFVLPNSLRSALIPFLARTPQRIGASGHFRKRLLTDVVQPAPDAARTHQAYEYMRLLGMPPDALEPPRLRPGPELIERAQILLGKMPPGALVALIPGAAYGAAKRWPAEYFAAAGQILKKHCACNIVVLGSANERELAAQVVRGMKGAALNLAGQTSLGELTALLSLCNVAIANDSGGMHLATAAGTPVAAIFGITNPAKTGPLGQQTRVLQNSQMQKRDIARNDPEAPSALRRITPAMVATAAIELMETKTCATKFQPA